MLIETHIHLLTYQHSYAHTRSPFYPCAGCVWKVCQLQTHAREPTSQGHVLRWLATSCIEKLSHLFFMPSVNWGISFVLSVCMCHLVCVMGYQTLSTMLLMYIYIYINSRNKHRHPHIHTHTLSLSHPHLTTSLLSNFFFMLIKG